MPTFAYTRGFLRTLMLHTLCLNLVEIGVFDENLAGFSYNLTHHPSVFRGKILEFPQKILDFVFLKLRTKKPEIHLQEINTVHLQCLAVVQQRAVTARREQKETCKIKRSSKSIVTHCEHWP